MRFLNWIPKINKHHKRIDGTLFKKVWWGLIDEERKKSGYPPSRVHLIISAPYCAHPLDYISITVVLCWLDYKGRLKNKKKVSKRSHALCRGLISVVVVQGTRVAAPALSMQIRAKNFWGAFPWGNPTSSLINRLST